MPSSTQPNHTYIAFDYGERRTGVAVGQSYTRTATPLKTIQSINHLPNWPEIEKIIAEWRPAKIIVGIPNESDENKRLRKKIINFSRELSQISN